MFCNKKLNFNTVTKKLTKNRDTISVQLIKFHLINIVSSLYLLKYYKKCPSVEINILIKMYNMWSKVICRTT